MLRHASYDTLAMNPLLLQNYRLIKRTQPFQLLAPLLVTASAEQRPLTRVALKTQAFDPIVPLEAAHTVRLALWQSRLLRLICSKDRAVSRFQEHMATFPYARQFEEEFRSKLSAYERTLEALRSSLRLLLNVEDEQGLFDLAAAVAGITRQRALAQLDALSPDSPTH